MLFLFIRIAYFTIACMKTVQLRRGARTRALPPPLEAACRRCESAFGMPRLEVLASNAASGPVTVGVIHNRDRA